MNSGGATGPALPSGSEGISASPAVSNESLQYQQPVPGPMSAPISMPRKQTIPEGSRPSRPSISLQVPERPSGTIRLATPPPVVVINGEANGSSGQDQNTPPDQPSQEEHDRTDFTHPLHPKNISRSPSPQRHVPEYYFEYEDDRTNMDEVIGFLTKCTRDAEWIDVEGNIMKDRPPVEEVTALVNTTIEAMWKATASPEAFLINLAAMAGGHVLLTDKSKVRRLGTEGGFLKYRCEWEYRFGSIKGFYTMEQGVPQKMATGREKYDGKVSEEEAKNMTAEQWQQKYHDMVEELRKKDRELLNIRMRLLR